MSRPCAACNHPKRNEIDATLIAGTSCREISALFSVSPYSLQRHKEKHLPQIMTKAKDAAEVAHGHDLLKQVWALQRKATSLLLQAEKSGDVRTALAGVREVRGCIELLAKITGEISDATTININLNPQWIETRTVIVSALAGYPEARVAVAEALAELEGA